MIVIRRVDFATFQDFLDAIKIASKLDLEIILG